MHVFPPDIKNISVSRNREIVLQTRDKTLLISGILLGGESDRCDSQF